MTDVLFIIYDLERGGPEMRLLNLARNLPADLRMHLCVTSTHLAMQDDFRDCGVPITVVPIKKPWREISKLAAIAHYCRAERIKVINVFDIKGLMVAAYLKATGSAIPVVFHHVASLTELTLRRRFLLRLMLGRAEHCICNSLFSREELRSFLPEKRISVIYNGIATDRFAHDNGVRHNVRSELQVSDSCTLFGIVANLRPEKNPRLLVDGFARLARCTGSVKLLIVGGGSLLESTRQWVAEAGLSERVMFAGYTQDVSRFMQAMDIVVLTSRSEGLPTVLLEAFAMGKPVITAAVGGCCEVVSHDVTGLTFPNGDCDTFFAAMEKLVSDADLRTRLAAAASADIHTRFTLDLMVQRYAGLFRDLAGGTAQ